MNKVASPREALSLIEDGSTLALGGFAITRCVMAMIHEVVRAGRRGLTLVQVVGGLDTDVLVGGGCASRLFYSGGSLDRFGFLHAVNHAAQSGALKTVEYSSLSLALRLHAGAMGLAHVASRSMLGSDLLVKLVETGDAIQAEDPFTGSAVVLLAPIRPDVAIIHADQADERGNAVIAGPHWTIKETAFASRRVILLCEELVPLGTIPPDRASIPASAVAAVVPVGRAAHPTAVGGRYDFDRAHLEKYVSYSQRSPQGMSEYLDRFVYGVADHAQYLSLAASA